MTLLGWQKLRTKICLLRACSNCKAIAEYDPYRWILQLWDNGLLNWTTFFFHFVLFLTRDKVLPWWCMLSSFISNNWRSIKYIIEKAWSCSQSGVGKLYSWLMCEQNLAPGTSCLWAETSKHLFHRPDLHLRVIFSCTRGRVWSHAWDGSHPRCRALTRGITEPLVLTWQYWNGFFLSRACPFLPFFLRQLMSYRRFCEVQPLTVESGLQPLH